MMMKGIKHMLCAFGIVLFASQVFGQIRVEVEQLSNGSDFESIDEIVRVPLNDFFKEMNPLDTTFKPAFEVDSANWRRLDIEALYDLDMGDVEFSDDDAYYGIGRYELNAITYYFVAVPNSSGWEVAIFVRNYTGVFTDGYTIASAMRYSEEEITTYGWVEYLKRSNEIIVITRTNESFQNRGGEESDEVIEELHDCQAFCLREGEFAPYLRGDAKVWNERYEMNSE